MTFEETVRVALYSASTPAVVTIFGLILNFILNRYLIKKENIYKIALFQGRYIMGFYFRKSAKVGLFRIKFSKSGKSNL